jgi:hypothetical protein
MQLVAGLNTLGAGKALQGGIIVKDTPHLESVLSDSKADVLIDLPLSGPQ